MSSSQISLILQPLSGGERTQITIDGPLPTECRRHEVRRLMAVLARLSGQPMLGVLCAVDAVAWSQIWAINLSDVPKDHLELSSGSTSGAAPVDDRQLPLFGVDEP